MAHLRHGNHDMKGGSELDRFQIQLVLAMQEEEEIIN